MGEPDSAHDRLRQLGVVTVELREPYADGPCFLRLRMSGMTVEVIVPPGVAPCEYALEQLGDVLPASGREQGCEADLGDYVVGYRSWLVESGQLRPWGTGADVWRGNAEVHATCHIGLHPAPATGCHCGFHCFHDVESAVAGDYFKMTEDPRIAVLGAVRCRGNLEVHHDGFRAEYAQPICLLGAPQLGLPSVDTPDELLEFATAYGTPVPHELRPQRPIRDVSAGHWTIWADEP